MHKFGRVFRSLVLAQLATGCGGSPAVRPSGSSNAPLSARTAEPLSIPPAPSAAPVTEPVALVTGITLLRVDAEKPGEFYVDVRQDGKPWSGDFAPLLAQYAGTSFYQRAVALTSCSGWLDAACKTAPDPKACAEAVRARPDGPCGPQRKNEQVAVKGGVVYAVSAATRGRDARVLLKALFPSFRDWEHAWLAARLYFMHAQLEDRDIVLSRQQDRWLVTGESKPAYVGGGPMLQHWKISLELRDDGSLLDKSSSASSYVRAVPGRRPTGLVRADSAAPTTLGRFFARAAHFEAASVVSFERVANELQRFGAPTPLVRRAAAAAKDELRHAKSMGKLRARFGAGELPLRVRKQLPRTFYAFARENAIEGCIFETYAALEAHYMCAAAGDASIRSRYVQIARDETRHAELAWDIHVWALTKLAPAQRRRITRGQVRALDGLRAEVQLPKEPALHMDAGLPLPRRARALCDAFFAERLLAA